MLLKLVKIITKPFITLNLSRPALGLRILTESKFLFKTHSDTEEADHVSQKVKESTVKPYARDEAPSLTFLHKSPLKSSKPSQPSSATKMPSIMYIRI